MKNTKTLTTAAILIALAVVINLVLYVLPIFQFALFLVGVPIVILGYKTNIKVQLLASLALVLLTAMLDPAYTLIIALIVLPLSILQGYCFNQKKKASENIFMSGLAMVFGFLGFLYLVNILFNVDMMSELAIMLDQSMIDVRSFYEQINTFSTQELDDMFALISEYKTYIMMMMPALIIMSSFISSLLSFLLSRKILIRMGQPIEKSYFKDFRIQGQGRMVLMVVLGVVTLISIVDKSNMEYYALNFMSVFTMMMQINGLAFIWYLSEKHPNRKSMRTIIVIMIVLSSILGPIAVIMRFVLGLLGFTDLYMNYRKKIEAREQ